MILLGSPRVVTQDFIKHGYRAEDYAGDHLSIIKLAGTAKVIRIVNKYKCHEDSINYNDYLKEQKIWKDQDYYNCISITGKKVRYHQSELGGNQVQLECYVDNNIRYITICHMGEVNVNMGDIIDSNTIIGRQGNTGLVLSNKSRSDVTYGSHCHLQIIDSTGKYINPREYANGDIIIEYINQSNVLDSTLKQFKVIVHKINIRQQPGTSYLDIGDVYSNEVYTILDEHTDAEYLWYKIKTSRGLEGWVANQKGQHWLELLAENIDYEPTHKVVDTVTNVEVKNLLFECPKDDIYYVKLCKGEKLYITKE